MNPRKGCSGKKGRECHSESKKKAGSGKGPTIPEAFIKRKKQRA